MANFIININELIAPYNSNTTLKVVENCSNITKSYSVGLVKQPIPLSTFIYLLSTYTGEVAYKTLHLTNIVYSDPTKFYIEYNTTIINSGTLDIDISVLPSDTTISNLLIKNIISTGEVDDRTISFDLAIEDINSLLYPSVPIVLEAVTTTCSTELEPSIGTSSTVNNPDCSNTSSIYQLFSVIGTPNTNVTFQYTTTDGGSHGFIGQLLQLDSYDGTTISTVTSFSNVVGTTYNVTFNMGNNNVRYFKAYLCARPRLDVDPNNVALTLNLRNKANTTNISTFYLTDTDD